MRARRTILDRLAEEYPLRISVVDLAADGGILFPPGVFLEGEAFCYGRLSERRLRRELERRRQSARR